MGRTFIACGGIRRKQVESRLFRNSGIACFVFVDDVELISNVSGCFELEELTIDAGVFNTKMDSYPNCNLLCDFMGKRVSGFEGKLYRDANGDE